MAAHKQVVEPYFEIPGLLSTVRHSSTPHHHQHVVASIRTVPACTLHPSTHRWRDLVSMCCAWFDPTDLDGCNCNAAARRAAVGAVLGGPAGGDQGETAFASCVPPLPSRLRQCLCLAVHQGYRDHRRGGPAAPRPGGGRGQLVAERAECCRWLRRDGRRRAEQHGATLHLPCVSATTLAKDIPFPCGLAVAVLSGLLPNDRHQRVDANPSGPRIVAALQHGGAGDPMAMAQTHMFAAHMQHAIHSAHINCSAHFCAR